MKEFFEKVRPKTKYGIVNYVIALLAIIQQALTFVHALSFEAFSRSQKVWVEVSTSLQQYMWFPTTGNGKLNVELGKILEKEAGSVVGKIAGDHSVMNHAIMFPVIMMVAAIVLLVVCVWFAGNKASTLVAAVYSIFGLGACFMPTHNFLFKMQSNFVAQMVLVILVTILTVLSIVLINLDKKKK